MLDAVVDPVQRILGVSEAARELALLDRELLIDQLEDVELRASVLRTLAPLSASQHAKDLQIQVDLSEDFVVKARAPILENSVLSNLLTNAIKFTPNGGKICVTGAALGNAVVVDVDSEGPHLAPNVVERILDGDQHLTTPGTAGERGSGFGLQIARAFVQLMAGTLGVENTPEGVRFSVTLPAATVESPARPGKVLRA